jgi:hypothetical protein
VLKLARVQSLIINANFSDQLLRRRQRDFLPPEPPRPLQRGQRRSGKQILLRRKSGNRASGDSNILCTVLKDNKAGKSP